MVYKNIVGVWWYGAGCDTKTTTATWSSCCEVGSSPRTWLYTVSFLEYTQSDTHLHKCTQTHTKSHICTCMRTQTNEHVQCTHKHMGYNSHEYKCMHFPSIFQSEPSFLRCSHLFFSLLSFSQATFPRSSCTLLCTSTSTFFPSSRNVLFFHLCLFLFFL